MISGAGFVVLALGMLAAGQNGGAGARAPVRRAPQSFDQIVAQANAAREQDRLDDALDLYRQALKLKPSWKEGWWFAGTLLYDKDRYAEAQVPFHQLIALDPQNGPALALLGLCEYQTRDYGPALTHLNRARLAGLGDNKQLFQVAFYHSALLLTKYKRYEQSLELLLEIVKRGMNGPKIVEAAGLAALRMPMLPADIPEPDRELVYLTGQAVTVAGERNAADAQKLFEEVLARYPATPNVHYVYGAFMMLNEPDRGLALFKQELEISPNHLPALVAIAFEYLKRGEPAKGLEYARRAVKSAPESFAAHAALGRVLVESGQVEDGIKSLQEAVKLAPDSPQVRIALASAYAKIGRNADAARERAEFLKLKNSDGAKQ